MRKRPPKPTSKPSETYIRFFSVAFPADHIQLNRELSELESLVESKIYREDELETRLTELQRELLRSRTHPKGEPLSAPSESSHSRTSSIQTGGEDRCELCDGPHGLDACPVFAGTTLGEGKPSPLAGRGKVGRYCADCEVRREIPGRNDARLMRAGMVEYGTRHGGMSNGGRCFLNRVTRRIINAYGESSLFRTRL